MTSHARTPAGVVYVGPRYTARIALCGGEYEVWRAETGTLCGMRCVMSTTSEELATRVATRLQQMRRREAA